MFIFTLIPEALIIEINRASRTRKMAHGGTHLNSSTLGACKLYSSDITSCNNTPGCHYDNARERCVGR